MTTKDWERFNKWFSSENHFAVEGYIIIYPSSIRYIKKPTDFELNYSIMGYEIYLHSTNKHIGGVRIQENNIRITTRDSRVIYIPYKHVKQIKIYKYNY